MAIFRKVHTSIWSDPFFSELDKDKKLFYLYLITNERTRQCGVYEITIRQISFDLSYSKDTVSKLLKYFISKRKINYNYETNEIALGNWLKYNSSTSPKVQSCIDKEFALVKDRVLIQYVKGMYTESQEEQEEEQEEKEEEPKRNSVDWDRLKDTFIKITGKKIRVVTAKAKTNLNNRLNEGYTKEDVITAIKNCFNDEYHIETKHKYLTIEFVTREEQFNKWVSLGNQKNTNVANIKTS